jgi:hypothetical protein
MGQKPDSQIMYIWPRAANSRRFIPLDFHNFPRRRHFGHWKDVLKVQPSLIFRSDRLQPKGARPASTNKACPHIFSSTLISTKLLTMALTLEPMIHDVFEPRTGTWQYVVADPSTKKAAIIDSVLDFDPATNTVTHSSADNLLSLVAEHGYAVDYILETHVHADHITAAKYLQRQLSAKQDHAPAIGIGKRVKQVQEQFARRYEVPETELAGAFDKLFDDDEVFRIGDVEAKAVHLPGHTPDHLGYVIGCELASLPWPVHIKIFVRLHMLIMSLDDCSQHLLRRLPLQPGRRLRPMRLPRRQRDHAVQLGAQAP